MYRVVFYKGDYRERQIQANQAKAICYVEHHFNASKSQSVNYSVVIVGSNASRLTKDWGRWYAKRIGQEFAVPLGGDDGIKVGGYGGRGNANLIYTKMPAILVEPLFATNPQSASIIKSEAGQAQLARVLVESIHHFFPNGGLVAFSVGHKYKKSNPNDRGASVFGGGYEADYAEKVLKIAEKLLIKGSF